MLMYVTADKVGGWEGGSTVTYHESEALKTLGPCEVWGREELQLGMASPLVDDPWHWDENFTRRRYHLPNELRPQLSHFYAGTFSNAVNYLKSVGSKITYTAAAHSIEISKREHEKLGVPYNYPHLTDPELWKRYVQGYLDADVVICPSSHSANCMKEYGCKNVVVIPHGVVLPDEPIKPLPKQFTVGYLGTCGAPDKGLRYLLAAWKKLNYPDAILLLAGHDSTSPFVQNLVREYGGGCIGLLGFQRFVGDFYNRLSVYVQPSASEGFGIEILEAMAFGRPVICSIGAGAADVVPLFGLSQFKVGACDTDNLASAIDYWKNKHDELSEVGETNRKEAEKYTWDIVRQRYIDLWKGLL